MRSHDRILTLAWLFLVVITMMSFWSNLHVHTQDAALGTIMIIAAIKVIVVLQHFMDANRLAKPMQIYFYIWSVGCAAMIFGIAAISR